MAPSFLRVAPPGTQGPPSAAPEARARETRAPDAPAQAPEFFWGSKANRSPALNTRIRTTFLLYHTTFYNFLRIPMFCSVRSGARSPAALGPGPATRTVRRGPPREPPPPPGPEQRRLQPPGPYTRNKDKKGLGIVRIPKLDFFVNIFLTPIYSVFFCCRSHCEIRSVYIFTCSYKCVPSILFLLSLSLSLSLSRRFTHRSVLNFYCNFIDQVHFFRFSIRWNITAIAYTCVHSARTGRFNECVFVSLHVRVCMRTRAAGYV